jgi:SAC3/GANP family
MPSPPPLDVYQFVWDRTRMVRKDFILQNFVGTGGLVDARAVRCHERIARWHCLCEHQLSHINDFVVMQSQQNVQELGQTMKTLNQFYDDSMCRALFEVPDEAGCETRLDMSGYNHGCEAEIVHGVSPVDYDGTPLSNGTNSIHHGLIGTQALRSPHHGTAEPEMRGLYILLTIDNDGGLEVNKYAARLFEERPEVYRTQPVQLALSVYKVRFLQPCFVKP